MLRRRDLRAGKKGGTGIGLTRRGKGSKVVALVDSHGLPIAIYACAADRHESHLVVQLLFDFMFLDEMPERIIGDKGYDDDELDAEMEECGIDMISPNCKNRRKDRQTQDKRKLRRYKRRWKVERINAWLQNFRRVCTRWERKIQNFLGMSRLACMVILLRYL